MQTHHKSITPRWGTLEQAKEYSGLGVRVLENAVKNQIVSSSLVRSFPGAKRGRRLIDFRSLDAWIEAGIGETADLPHLVRTQKKGDGP